MTVFYNIKAEKILGRGHKIVCERVKTFLRIILNKKIILKELVVCRFKAKSIFGD